MQIAAATATETFICRLSCVLLLLSASTFLNVCVHACMHVWHNCKFALHLCDVACDCTWLIDNAVSGAVLHVSGVLLIDNDIHIS